ncbi:gamma-glutamyl-gamma-aminobutyrate hydrolase family protein [Psychrobacter sp. SCQQ22]|uniref:gamma-glutamyl-gamma-aminobutyrate hydrolase n=1 Tax=Psychrobacter fozii TaxID=198480 RepID=A0A2V4V123_9GAMM|nr:MULTISPECIES: gamma-glutamyl-gamma-aminobutyrate hydrolase family protein [Psychrobacter]MBH0086454.1 gamma-glutamyl-gamma-aminobutyrate hydrolase family protein [Psychrobacter sp. SCQQ22]PYE39752.1 gamma-glutamyl-gamma-aminobutyrate hydrolase [Psychrobacter fozii]
MPTSRPIIAIVSCHKMVDGQPAQAVYQKYIDAIQYYGGNPILLPYTAADSENFDALVALADGIVLTGSYSNVAPMRYGASHVEEKQDLNRDELSFKLLAYSAESGTPLLAVCRGLQEMNVHFNGTLYPDWREVEGFYEQHLEDNTQPLEVQYQPVHDVIIQPEGKLAAFGDEWHVNSLHKQAINKVGEGLFVEALARDGLVEAISLIEHPFMIGVQWHPELNYAQDGFSKFLFTEFIHYASQTKS